MDRRSRKNILFNRLNLKTAKNYTLRTAGVGRGWLAGWVWKQVRRRTFPRAALTGRRPTARRLHNARGVLARHLFRISSSSNGSAQLACRAGSGGRRQLVGNFGDAATVERHLPGEHPVEDHAQGKDIAASPATAPCSSSGATNPGVPAPRRWRRTAVGKQGDAKSAIMTWPLTVRRMLAGLMSRWTTPSGARSLASWRFHGQVQAAGEVRQPLAVLSRQSPQRASLRPQIPSLGRGARPHLRRRPVSSRCPDA